MLRFMLQKLMPDEFAGVNDGENLIKVLGVHHSRLLFLNRFSSDDNFNTLAIVRNLQVRLGDFCAIRATKHQFLFCCLCHRCHSLKNNDFLNTALDIKIFIHDTILSRFYSIYKFCHFFHYSKYFQKKFQYFPKKINTDASNIKKLRLRWFLVLDYWLFSWNFCFAFFRKRFNFACTRSIFL